MRKYLIGGAFIGLMQVVDSALLVRAGAMTIATLVLGSVEFFWAVVSLVVVFAVKDVPTRRISMAFFGYNLFGWIAGLLSSPNIPRFFFFFGGAFGILYGMACVVAYRSIVKRA